MRILSFLILTSLVLTSCTYGNVPNTSTGAVKPPVPAGPSNTGITNTWMSLTGATSTGVISIPPTSTGMVIPVVSGPTSKSDHYQAIFKWYKQESFQINHTTGKSTTVTFTNSEAKAIDIAITFPNSLNNNLRVSQIIAPDGSMDGPFGRDMQYNLKKNGAYEIIISENMMAESPYTGTATITLTLREKSYPNAVNIIK